MRILLSAFNCNPNKGSEERRGWAWATGLSQMGNEVWVITKSENQRDIEQVMSENSIPNLHFYYVQFSEPTYSAWWMFPNKQIGLLPQNLALESVLFKWQWDAYKTAKVLTQRVAFDWVQHVTNTCVRRYSFMGLLGIPFIFGPLAGGVKAPRSLRKSYPFMGRIIDFGRDLANISIQFNPLMHLSFAKASKIFCDSKQTQAFIPRPYRAKSEVLFSMPPTKITGNFQIIERKSTEKEIFKVLYVGRFMFWKGVHLGLRAFAQLHQKMPNSCLTVVGCGPETGRLQALTEQLEIKNAVEWVSWIDQKKLSLVYLQHDVFLFPSLHEMGGNVILESFSHALPVVCLDLGGPGLMVNDTCGKVIKTDGLGEEEVIKSLSNALMELAKNPEIRHQLSQGALMRVNQIEQFAWKDILAYVNREYKTISMI